jgi:hypothetical protein
MIRETIAVLGVVYNIIKADLASNDEGEMDADSCEIRVASSATPPRYWSIVRHEIGHAAWHESGAGLVMRQDFGMSDETARKAEEIVMSVFLPTFCDALERKGLLSPMVLQEYEQ